MPKPPFKSLDEASRWAADHDARHLVLEDEIREKVRGDMSAAIQHVEKLGKQLDAQDRELGEIKVETKGQTKTLRSVRRELRLAREERLKRRAIEENAQQKEKKLRRWALFAAGILATLAGAYAAARGH